MQGKTLVVKGELRSNEDITIDGRLEGSIQCEGCAVVLSASADITADILASDITILGRSAGQLTATEVVEIRDGAIVTGRVVAKRFILQSGATFNGRVEPERLDAALTVAKYKERKREEKLEA
jgi:cytoskeletal protein CcmA (bactofilin family)